MQVALIGLGKMGGNMVERLVQGGHQVVAYDRDQAVTAKVAAGGATPAASLEDLVSKLTPRRPVFKTLAPPDGFLRVGPAGAGHYVKMVHNGIEYGMLQAYAEGFEVLESSEFDLDLGAIAHLWNQGSVVRSWLLELTELALAEDPGLAQIKGYVDDTGEGRWTLLEALQQNVPTPVLALSLMMRIRSRQSDSFAAKYVAALRNQFGGHAVKRD